MWVQHTTPHVVSLTDPSITLSPSTSVSMVWHHSTSLTVSSVLQTLVVVHYVRRPGKLWSLVRMVLPCQQNSITLHLGSQWGILARVLICQRFLGREILAAALLVKYGWLITGTRLARHYGSIKLNCWRGLGTQSFCAPAIWTPGCMVYSGGSSTQHMLQCYASAHDAGKHQ